MSDETPGGPGPTDTGRPAEDLPLPSGSARVFASTIDIVVAGVLLGLVDSLLFVVFVGPVQNGKLTPHQSTVSLLVSLVVLLAAAFLWVLLERTGGSLGKRFAGLRTTTLDGTYPAPVSQLAVKYLLIFALLLVGPVGIVLLLAGLLVPFWQKQRRNVFDIVARVRTVPRSALRVDEPASSDTPSAPAGPASD